jgi:hypothetical protein
MANDWMADLYESMGNAYESMGDAVADVRQKVVEEGYFGRAVTQLDVDAPQFECPHWPETQEVEAQQQPEQQLEHGQGVDL